MLNGKKIITIGIGVLFLISCFLMAMTTNKYNVSELSSINTDKIISNNLFSEEYNNGIYFSTDKNKIYLTNNYNDSLIVTMNIKDSNPLSISSVSNPTIRSTNIEKGLEFFVEFDNPDYEFEAYYEMECSGDLENNGDDIIKCGNIIVNFSIMKEEYSDMLSNVKPQKYDLSYLQIDKNNLHVKATLDSKYSLNEGDKIVLDPLVSNAGDSTDLAEAYNEKIVRDSSGNLHLVYIVNGDDIAYWNSTNNGLTWSGPTVVFSGSGNDLSLVIDSSDNLYAFWDEAYDIRFARKPAGSDVWDRGFIVLDGDTENRPEKVSGAIDSSDVIHMCIATRDWEADANKDLLIYTYSNDGGLTWYNDGSVTLGGNILNGTFLVTDEIDDVDYCDVAVDTNDNVYIVGAGSVQDKIDIWSSIDSFASRNLIDNSGTNNLPAIAIDSNNNNLYVSYVQSSDLWFSNTTSANWDGTWSSQELISTDSNLPDIKVTSDGEMIIMYDNYATSNTVSIVNSTDLILFNQNDLQGVGESWAFMHYAGMRGSTFPTTNRITDRVDYLYKNESVAQEIYFNNFSVSYTPAGDTCTCVTDGNWEIDCSDNCVINELCQMQEGTNLSGSGSGTIIISEGQIIGFDHFIFSDGCNFLCKGPGGYCLF